MEKRRIIVSYSQVEIALRRSPAGQKAVVLQFEQTGPDTGLMPEIALGIALLPDEARQLATRLISMAREAEDA